MPYIPLLRQPGPIGAAPAPVLDRQQRPNVDNRAVSQAVGNLADASTIKPVDAEGITAPIRALGAVGEAVAKGGSIMQAAALTRLRAESTIQIASADQMMADIAAEQEKFQEKNPDPRAWTPNFEALRAKAKSQILSQEGLHPGAKADIQLRLSNWERETARTVDLNGSKKTNALARDASLTNMENSFMARKYDDARAAMKTAIADGYAWGHELPALESRIERARKQDETEARQAEHLAKVQAFNVSENLAVSMSGNLGEAETLAALERGEMGKHEPADAERLRNTIQRVAADRRAASLETLAEGIASGTITTPAAIDAAPDAHLSPLMKTKAKEMLRGFRADQVRQEIETNGIRNAIELRQKVKAYDPKQDPTGEEFFRLNLEISSRVDSENAGELAGPLYQKYAAWNTPPKRETRPEILRNVSQSLDVMFDPETGAMPWRTSTEDAAGKKTVKEDAATRQAAIDAQTKVEMGFNDWAKQNPDKANNLSEVQKRLGELLPEGTRAGALGTLRNLMAPQAPAANVEPPNLGAQGDTGADGPEFTPAPPASRVTSYAYRNDETPDTNSTAGIGAFVPDEEQAKIKRGEDSPYKLRQGDFAVSRDVEARMRKAGIRPGDQVEIQYGDGTTETGRWMDRTAEEWPPGSGNKVTGRWDFYQGGKTTKHPKEAAKVVSFRPA